MKIQTRAQMGFYVAAGVVMLIMAAAKLAESQSASAPQSKEAMLQRMVELDSAIENLKFQVAANPNDKSLRSQLDAAIAEGNKISVATGGDRAPNRATGFAPASINAPAVIPTAPAGCGATTATFSNMTPVAIPDNNMTGATSTISVAGAGAFLWDVDVTVNIPHTFSADIDFTLTSPAGTIITLSTDNGGGNDNTWNGTTFDDQADPASPIPYASNPNITTDHLYADLTVATPLTPEEPLGAFTGQDPNGTWTLKVVDDLGGDSGTITSWSLGVTTFASAPTNDAPVTASNATPVAIPDNNMTGATSTITVTSPGISVCDLNVTVNIPHTFAADLDFTLTSPAGTTVTLSTDNGAGNDNVFNGTTFDDQANPGGQVPYTSNNGVTTDNTYADLTVATPLTPEEPLAAFNGQDPNGTWTLKVVDDLGGDSGTINSWSLNITTCACTANPTLTTQASPSTTVGSPISDSATLAGGANPTGTITFTLYEFDDTTCSGAPIFTSPVAVAGNGVYNSGNFTPTRTGVYRWIAAYSGDAANTAISGACNDANESVTVSGGVIRNLSTRMRVETGDNIGIGGFIVVGSVPKHVIVRAIGPALMSAGLTGLLADPVLELHGPGAFVTVTNDNWRDTQEAEIAATNLPPTNDSESAIVATLDPGAYTALVSGANGTSGLALVEVYDLDSSTASELANISTRAFVNTGNNLVIAGFILGQNAGDDSVVIRGLGPSLEALGVQNVLADPALELRDTNGSLIFSDNDWQDNPPQAAAISGAGLAPDDPAEAGIFATLPAGAYTALLTGLNGGTGVGLVEIYQIGIAP